MMDPVIKLAWTVALRSGDYIQGKDNLLTPDGRYCCLGVLADVQGCNIDTEIASTMTSELPVPYRAGLSLGECEAFAMMNDSGKPFDEIADLIEEML